VAACRAADHLAAQVGDLENDPSRVKADVFISIWTARWRLAAEVETEPSGPQVACGVVCSALASTTSTCKAQTIAAAQRPRRPIGIQRHTSNISNGA
jgi:hypothetical protein